MKICSRETRYHRRSIIAGRCHLRKLLGTRIDPRFASVGGEDQAESTDWFSTPLDEVEVLSLDPIVCSNREK